MLKPPPDDEVRRQFDEAGYVSLPNFFARAEVDDLLANVQLVIRDVVPAMPNEHVFHEVLGEAETLKQLQHLEVHDPWFRELIAGGKLRALAESLLAGPVAPKNLQYFNKPPGIGQPTPPHQDGYYFMLEPCEALTMWLALDEADEETGCVRYVAGSHTAGMRPHQRTQTLGFSQGISDYPTEEDRMRERPLPAPPGDLLAHHALTIHRADGNRSSTRGRRSLGFIYYSGRVREDRAAHEAYQRKLAAELAQAGRISFNFIRK